MNAGAAFVMAVVLGLCCGARGDTGEGQRRRLAIVTAASDGGGDRERLRYAVADAELVAAALREVGGTDDDDLTLLLDTTVKELDQALDRTAENVVAARAGGARVEIVFYYSGHSDETGLLLAGSTYPWAALRARLRESGADLAVVVVDSCASGALTRTKGGSKAAPPRLGADVTGLAILTSSSASEAAQESARLGGSYFTHALVSALRGAGDRDDDGVVSIDEAYAYAYDATLLATETTRGGAQHAAHELELRGVGQIPFADLRERASRFVVDADVAGRIAVYDPRGRNVAELAKRTGKAVTLALPAGSYRVFVDAAGGLGLGALLLPRGATVKLSDVALQSVSAEETLLRGVPPTLSPRGRALAEQEYAARSIGWGGLFGTDAVRGPTAEVLPGSALYRTIGEPGLAVEAEKRAAFRDGLTTTAAVAMSTGTLACLGGCMTWLGVFLCYYPNDVPRKHPASTAAVYTSMAGFGLMNVAAATGLGAALCSPEPLAQDERAEKVERYNEGLRQELGLTGGAMAH